MSTRTKVWLAAAVVGALVVAGLGGWWFTQRRLPTSLTVDAAGDPGEWTTAASWGARGELRGDRRLLRQAYRAWVDPGGADSAQAHRLGIDGEVAPSTATEIRVVYAGRVDGTRLVAMVAPDGRAAVYRQRPGQEPTLSSWDHLGSAGLAPVLSLRTGDRGTVYLVHPRVRRLEVAAAGEPPGIGPAAQSMTWRDAEIHDGLARVEPQPSRVRAVPPCGNPLLRAHLDDGAQVTMLHASGTWPLSLAVDQVRTPIALATVAQVACELPDPPLAAISVRQVWSGALPGVDGLVGDATALWVRATPAGATYGLPVTDYGVLAYATEEQVLAVSVLATRLSYELPGPALLAGQVCLPTGAFYVAAGTEMIERITLVGQPVGTGGAEFAGRVAAAPVQGGQCPAYQAGSGFETMLAVGFDASDRPYAALSGAGPRSTVYR